MRRKGNRLWLKNDAAGGFDAKKTRGIAQFSEKLLTSTVHCYIIIMICRQKMSAGKKEKNHEEHETGSGVPRWRGDDAADGFAANSCVFF